MTTPGQSNTTDLDVLRETVNEIGELDGLHTGNVMLAAAPSFLGVSWGGDQYVQVVPGVASDNSRAGHGYIDDQIRVFIFKQLWLDQAGQDTEALAHSSAGLLLLVKNIENKLTNNFLGGLLAKPFAPQRREPSGVPIEAANWACVTRVFSMAYRTEFSSPHNTG